MATLEELIMQSEGQKDVSTGPLPSASFASLVQTQELADIVNPVEAAVESGDWTTKDSVMGAAMFIEGMTLGWSDEAISGIAAYGESLATGEEYKDVYRKYKTTYEQEAAAFKERQPTAAMGAEIAGAIVSPLSKIKAASTLTGLAIRGGVEGGIYGAGAAGQDDNILAEAGKGLAFGGAAGATLGSVGWLMKRKVKADLVDEAGEFIPITLSADKADSSEALLQSFYRDIVGPSYGGKGIIRAQEEKASPLIKLKDVVMKSKEEVGEATRAINNAEASLNKTTSMAKKTAADELADESDLINGLYKKQLGSKGIIINKATAKLKEAVETSEDAFRVQAFSNSLPVNIPKKDISDILDATNPNMAMDRLEDAWQANGFKSIKDRSFKMKTDDLVNDINKAIEGDTQLQLLAATKGEISNLVNNGLTMVAAKINPKTGVISGKDFSDIRSAFGTAAARSSDAGGQGALMQAAYRKIQQVLDDKMMSQLSSKRQVDFKADLSAWASQTVLRDAVTKASTKTGKAGKFSPDDWLMAIKNNSSQQIRRGKGPLRAEAETIAALNKRTDESIMGAADRLQKWAETKRAKAINTSKKRNNAIIEKLDNQKDVLTRRLSIDKTAPEKLAQVAKNKIAAKENLSSAEEALLNMQKARTPESPSWYHSIAATGSLAAATGAIAGPAVGTGALVAAAGLGQVLAKPSVQKAMAGQTAFQQGAQNIASSPIGSQALGMVPSAPRALVGMLTGQQQ